MAGARSDKRHTRTTWFESPREITILSMNCKSPSPKSTTGRDYIRAVDRNEVVSEIIGWFKEADFMLLQEMSYTEKNMRKKLGLDDKHEITPLSRAGCKIVYRNDRFTLEWDTDELLNNLYADDFPILFRYKSRLSLGVFRKVNVDGAAAYPREVHIMVASWHGPHKMRREVKRWLLEELVLAIGDVAENVARKLRIRKSSLPVVVAGDFNCNVKEYYDDFPRHMQWLDMHDYS